MLKKLILLLSCTSLLILVACDGENEYPPTDEAETDYILDVPATEYLDEFEFRMEAINDDELTELENYIVVDYSGGRTQEGVHWLFYFSQAVSDFSFIRIAITEDGSIHKTGVLNEVGNINLDQSLVLMHYMTTGTLPVSGFYFTGPDGEENWYVFQISQMDGEMHWWPFDWSRDYDLFDPDAGTHDPNSLYHEVVAGETLFSISQLYDTTVEVLQQLNDLGTSTHLSIGQMLRLPDGSSVNNGPMQALPLDFDIRIEWLDERHFPVQNYIEIKYAEDQADPLARNLFIVSEEALRGFAIITLDPAPDGYFEPEVLDVMFYAGNLNPNQPLLILNYIGFGTMPRSGFTFENANGVRRFFFFTQNQADEGPEFIIGEFTVQDFDFWDFDHMQ